MCRGVYVELSWAHRKLHCKVEQVGQSLGYLEASRPHERGDEDSNRSQPNIRVGPFGPLG